MYHWPVDREQGRWDSEIGPGDGQREQRGMGDVWWEQWELCNRRFRFYSDILQIGWNLTPLLYLFVVSADNCIIVEVTQHELINMTSYSVAFIT